MLRTLLLSLLFILSEAGYCLLLSRRFRLRTCFLPMITLSSQICILFLGGILNLLLPAAIVLYGAGIFLFGACLLKDRRSLRIFLQPEMLLLLAVSVLYAVLLRGVSCTYYDDFSHWAKIVKVMLSENRLPNFQDTSIRFQSYPPGTACILYYFCKITMQSSESAMLLFQNILSLSFLLSVFAFAGEKRKFLSLIVILPILFFYPVMRFFYNLQVDALLGVSGAGAVILVYSLFTGSRKNGWDSDKIVWTILVIAALILFKNSALFFSVIASGLLIQKLTRKNIWRRLAFISAPYSVLLIWKSHCSYVFLSAATTSHAMSLQNYLHEFRSKSWPDIYNICSKMVKFAFSGGSFWFSILALIITGTIIFILMRPFFKTYLKTVLCLIFFYLFYQLGLLLMYLFSMPLGEAKRLACAERYRETFIIFLFCIIFAFVIHAITNAEIHQYKQKIFCVISICILGLCYSRVKIEKNIFARSVLISSFEDMQNTIETYHVDPDKSYFIISPAQKDNAYYECYSKYHLNSEHVFVISKLKNENLTNIYRYDYVFAMDKDNPILQSWIRDTYPEQEGAEVIRTARQIEDIDEYLSRFSGSGFTIFLSVCGNAASGLRPSTLQALSGLGLTQSWDEEQMKRCGYLAVIENGNVREISSQPGQKAETAGFLENGDSYAAVSEGRASGKPGMSSIVISGTEYAVNKPGINIVVWDESRHIAVDAAAFDTADDSAREW